VRQARSLAVAFVYIEKVDFFLNYRSDQI